MAQKHPGDQVLTSLSPRPCPQKSGKGQYTKIIPACAVYYSHLPQLASSLFTHSVMLLSTVSGYICIPHDLMCCCIIWLSSHMNNFETVIRLFSQFFGQDLGTRLFDNNIKILFPEKFIQHVYNFQYTESDLGLGPRGNRNTVSKLPIVFSGATK